MVTVWLADLIEGFCRSDVHLNPADLIRDAIRDKVSEICPGALQQVFPGDLNYGLEH